MLCFDLDDAPFLKHFFGWNDTLPDQNAFGVFAVFCLPLYAFEHQFLVFFDGCGTAFNHNYVGQPRRGHSICYQAHSTQVELLCVHVHFEAELRLEGHIRHTEESNLTLIGRVSVMLALHLWFLLFFVEFAWLVSLQMSVHPRSHYLLDFSFAGSRVLYSFLGHDFHKVWHGHPWQRSRRQSQLHFLLLVFLLLKALFTSKFFLFRLSQHKRHCHFFVCLNAIIH